MREDEPERQHEATNERVGERADGEEATGETMNEVESTDSVSQFPLQMSPRGEFYSEIMGTV